MGRISRLILVTLALSAGQATGLPAQPLVLDSGATRAPVEVPSPSPGPAMAVPAVAIPYYWDPRQRPERPDISSLRVIRFLTEEDYPPLHFLTDEGKLAGFNVDLARSICDVLRLACTVQARRWETLLDALKEGRGDAVIASLRITTSLRAQVGFSQAYLKTPARFVGRLATTLEPGAKELADKSVAVLAGSAHEAYLRAFFPAAKAKAFDTLEAARRALQAGDVDVLFGDGLTLSLWLNGAEGAGCCRFVGGPYTESRYFGEGVGIATRQEDILLRRALDYGLYRVAEKGAFAELYLRYFPVSFY